MGKPKSLTPSKKRQMRLTQKREYITKQRAEESEQERETRLFKNRERIAIRRAAERLKRLTQNKKNIVSLSQPTPLRTTKLLKPVEKHQTQKHILQNFQVKENIGKEKAKEMAMRRVLETPQQSQTRLLKMKNYMAKRIAAETSEERTIRLSKMRKIMAERVTSETQEQYEKRLSQMRKIMAERIISETQEQYEARLSQMRKIMAERIISETQEQYEARLSQMRKIMSERIISETQEQYEERLSKMRKIMAERVTSETQEQYEERLSQMRKIMSERIISETQEQYEERLSQMRNNTTKRIAAETPEEYQVRTSQMKQRMTERRIAETQEQYQTRLNQDRQNKSQIRNKLRSDIATFNKSVNTFCEKVCQICTKQCYPIQISSCCASQEAFTYLPAELSRTEPLTVCHRCKNYITSKKLTSPPKAYWNNLNPGAIPNEILALTQSEQRLLSRVIPFLKIIKLTGKFGQYGFRGQAVLFAQDLFEVSEKLPNMLPRSTDNAGIVVVTEILENLNITREFSIDRPRVYNALRWLIANNPLYKDVTINNFANINESDIIRVVPQQLAQNLNNVSAFTIIEPALRIVRASWHQGDDAIFQSGYAGVQCCAMALANIVRAAILLPSKWNTLVLNSNLIEGDKMYAQIRALSQHQNAIPIYADGYLMVRNFTVIKDNFIMYNNSFGIVFEEDSPYFGSLQDVSNDYDNLQDNEIGSRPLKKSLEILFSNHNAGILIAASKSLAVLNYENKYYFADSHSCGAKGSSARSEHGRACVLECDTIEVLARLCKRATGSRNMQYTLDYIDVYLHDNIVTCQENETVDLISLQDVDTAATKVVLQTEMPISTSVLAPIDFDQPDVEDELEVSNNINKIRRKTTNNIVNEAHEIKSEEFAWYYLFPYGVNGLKQERPVKITPLDYYQFRILGNDTRFQRTDYLFYALSMFEYYRVKSTIATCAKKIEGQNGQVEDVHLNLKNLRGSSAYWRTALNDLIAQIRCIGPPTYFVTFSCNDLNWPDMKKALLIADKRPNEEPCNLDVFSTQLLVEKYPVIVSRHFMIRVNALLKFIRNNNEVFDGQLVDFWWRIEFQNRGSPHLHMVVWIKDHPSFNTPEGIEQLDRICSCYMPAVDSELHKLIKVQIHRHSTTCKKNDLSNMCRFNFPRQVCNATRIIAHSSDEFIRSGNRICLLKRRYEDRWVNNYNPTLLQLWQANMDIQPCGSNESIAFYIAKYISKAEPAELDVGVAQAIQQIRREETNISIKLFKICMRILRERQISACECVYRLAHLDMRGSSRKCIFLNTRKPDQRYRMIQFDKNGRAAGYANNIFDRYERRPETDEFHNMSLTEFAMRFEPYYAKIRDEEYGTDNDAYEPHLEQPTKRKFITLIDNTKMVVRTTPAIVRVPHFIAANDPENYYYSLLLQYMPYRQEVDLINEFDTSREAFLAAEERLKEINHHMDTFRARDRQLENAFVQIHAFEIFEVPPLHIEDVEELVEIDDSMTDEQFNAAQRAMNVGQHELFVQITRNIQQQLNGNTTREHLFITGGAGTGKTFVFNLLKNQVNRCYAKAAVKVASLTGVAARLVGGLTLHSLLKLPVQKDGKVIHNLPLLTGNFLRVMRQQWKDTEFFFIDEISMVPYEMLCMIDSRLKQLKNNNDLFGGINILLFGDLMQLPPVRGKQVFDQPEYMLPATHLWRLFTLIELNENMRQQGDNSFVEILNALRIGELRDHHMSILINKVTLEASGEFSIEKALRIYPTNKKVDNHNQIVLAHFKSKNINMYKIRADDRLVDGNDNNIDYDKITPTDINKTAALPRELELFVGAKVMLRSNIDTSKGLVNGAIGFIVEIVWPNFRRAQMYATDIPSLRIDFGKDGIHIIPPISKQFPAIRNQGTIERRMLPIILSWASTVHKMQGSTVDFAVIDLGSDLFAEGQAYVALSRVRSLDGLQIQDLDCAKLTGKKPCNNKALAEMERMRSIT